jgi:UDP-N-acetylenolpyruvoylglucosamine reductase
MMQATAMDRASGNLGHAAHEMARWVSEATLIRCNEPLAKRTTLRVGGPADIYVEPASEEDLGALIRFCAEHRLAFFVLGRGSNLLVKDAGFRGVVICLSQAQFNRIEIVGEQIHCGAGTRLKAVAIEAKRIGLAGVEFLEGIPGTVGGALRMNAGAMGGAMFDTVDSVRMMDFAGNIREHAARELPVEYRSCAVFKSHIALAARLTVKSGMREAIERRMNECSRKRWQSQPAAPSAGCMFKNPASIPAGKLIDELGLKGTRVGGAVVSLEHGNFIVLIGLLKRRAREERGIELQTEVEIIGE